MSSTSLALRPVGFDTRQLIISRPDLQSLPQRWLFAAVTLAIWTGWIWLWLPLIDGVAEALGTRGLWPERSDQRSWSALMDLLLWCAGAIVLLWDALLMWAAYNLERFRGGERRRAARSVGTDVLAMEIGILHEELGHWQHAQEMRVHHDEQGDIAHIEHRHALLAHS